MVNTSISTRTLMLIIVCLISINAFELHQETSDPINGIKSIFLFDDLTIDNYYCLRDMHYLPQVSTGL